MLPKIITDTYKPGIRWIVVITLLIFAVACSRKLELKDIKDIHKVTVSGIDSIYYVYIGDTLRIRPQLSGGEGNTADTGRYKVEWAYYYPRMSRFYKIDGQELAFVPTKDFIGDFTWYYRIIDTRTGLFTQQEFHVTTLTPTKDGWFALCDLGNGDSRLDMLSYDPKKAAYTSVTDIIAKMGSSYKMTGTPSSVDYAISSLNFKWESVFVVTDKASVQLNPDDLSLQSPVSDGFAVSSGFNPASFTAVYSVYASLFNVNGRLYYAGSYSGDAEGPLPRSAADATALKASPLMASSEDHVRTNTSDAIVFDEENQTFLKISSPYGDAVIPVPMGKGELFDFNVKKKLVSIDFTPYNGGEFYAVLQDNDASVRYLAIFNANGKQRYFAELKGTDINQASHFAVSAEFGYLFYSVGSKVYEFDPINRANLMVADMGGKRVSYLSAPKFPMNITFAEQRLRDMSRKMIIATYEAGKEESSGVIGIFDVPAANEALKPNAEYTGFGKVVSMSYRENL